MPKQRQHPDATTLDRRGFISGLAAMLVLASNAPARASKVSIHDRHIEQLRRIEAEAGGRLGAYIFDTQSKTGFGWRANERFTHCSSFKMSLAAMVLHLADQGKADLNEVLRWTKADMLFVSPITKANLARGLSVEALAHATLVTSDNTAANVLLKRFGGPKALTSFWRSLGDTVSRLDRYEPELNQTPAGTSLDTTTPLAMANTTATLVQGDFLAASTRSKLKAWMAEVRTGTDRIRAGFPAHWRSGDKTGTGLDKSKHTYVDLAYGGPEGRAPLIVTAYFEPTRMLDAIDPLATKVLADVGRVAVASMESSKTGT